MEPEGAAAQTLSAWIVRLRVPFVEFPLVLTVVAPLYAAQTGVLDGQSNGNPAVCEAPWASQPCSGEIRFGFHVVRIGTVRDSLCRLDGTKAN